MLIIIIARSQKIKKIEELGNNHLWLVYCKKAVIMKKILNSGVIANTGPNKMPKSIIIF